MEKFDREYIRTPKKIIVKLTWVVTDHSKRRHHFCKGCKRNKKHVCLR